MLALKYCQSCHLFPDPSLLDTKSWENGVLPHMGPRLGIFNYDFKTYPSFKNDRNLVPDFYPAQPLLSLDEWQKIIDYYTAISPDSLPQQDRTHNIRIGLPRFKVQIPEDKIPSPAICLTKIDTTASLHQLWIFDLSGKSLYPV